ncbi:MAG: protein kinase [Myxococcota bacterium]
MASQERDDESSELGSKTRDAREPNTREDGLTPEPASEPRGGRGQRRLEDLVLQQLFDVEPEAETIGRYRVLERIGQGGMGTVFSAYDEGLDRKVAIKVLDSPGENTAASARLQREAQALARLSHPNVVTVHEVGEADGELFVVMEFLRGQSLDAWIHERPAWPEVLEVFAQAGRGIVAAHAAGLVHRDLKPHNIMRTDDGAVKVLDFGLARADDTHTDDDVEGPSEPASFDAQLTRTGALLGTPAYMAPEQHRGEPADTRTDQYGFCAALHHVLYGRLPFAADTMQVLVAKILANRIDPPPSDSQVPSWLARVVRKGLSAAPDERWPSMQALLDALARDPAKIRRRRLTIAGLGLAAVLSGYGLSELRTEAANACPSPQDERELLWSAARRESVQAAFTEANPRRGADTLSRTAEPIATYVDAMGQMRTEACEARREGGQSERLFGLRTACLDIRRAGVDQLLERFEHADAAAVDNAAWAVASLPRVEPCGDVEALLASVPPPDDPETAEQVQLLRETLASARSMGLAGAYDDALSRAKSAVETAERLDYGPAIAEAQLRHGDILREANDHTAAYDVLSRAIRSALGAMHYEAAAEAVALRNWIEADRLDRPKQALATDEIADGMLEAIGRPPRLQWLLLNNRAVAQARDGRLVEAERSYRAALEAARAPGEGALPVEVISTLANLAILQSEGLGRPGAAAKELRSARERAVALLGPENPRVFALTSMLAEFLGAAGRPQQAQQQLELARQHVPPDAYSRVQLQIDAAQLAHQRRDYEASLRNAESALTLARQQLADDSLVSVALWRRGSARVELGQTDAGLQDLEDAVARELKRSGPDSESVALARTFAGLGLQRLGRTDEAIAQLEQALEITVALGPSAQPAVGRRFFDLGDAYLQKGSLSKASALLGRIAEAQDAAGFAADSIYRLQLDLQRGALAAARGETAAARTIYQRVCPRLAARVEPDTPDLVSCRQALARLTDDTSPANSGAEPG